MRKNKKGKLFKKYSVGREKEKKVMRYRCFFTGSSKSFLFKVKGKPSRELDQLFGQKRPCNVVHFFILVFFFFVFYDGAKSSFLFKELCNVQLNLFPTNLTFEFSLIFLFFFSCFPQFFIFYFYF